MCICICSVIDVPGADISQFLSYIDEDGRDLLVIPQSTIGKKLMFVSRVTKNAFGFDVYGAGHYLSKLTAQPLVFVFEEYDNRIFMRFVRSDISADSETAVAVCVNNLAPIFYVFDINSKDIVTGEVIIDISALYGSQLPWLRSSSKFGVSGVDGRGTYLHSVQISKYKAEFKQFVTYYATSVPNNPTNAITIELTHTMILLPVVPMLPRLDLGKSGYYTIQADGDDFGRSNQYIQRWKLQPSSNVKCDTGELLAPDEPIIFYIDPSMPRKWRGYVKLGIEDWNGPFEEAGFKEAIRAVQVEDTLDSWQTLEMRAVVRFVPGSKVASASIIHDPRSGEILECSIQLGEHKIESISNRFFVQTAASNPEVRGGVPDRVKGQLIRRLVSHEVGHALGLVHHRGANRAYCVDSLRSPVFTERHGLAASIMDYTCGNYVAQPEDGVKSFYDRIGDLDRWAIEYGYRVYENVKKPGDEREFLSALTDSKIYDFEQENSIDVDFELGDRALYSGRLGLQNLRAAAAKFKVWTDADRANLKALYEAVLNQYEVLMRSVSSKLENCDTTVASFHEDKLRLLFLIEMLFETPTWLTRIAGEHQGLADVKMVQEAILRELLIYAFANRVKEGDGERVLALLMLLRGAIFEETLTGYAIDEYRRHLQHIFVASMVTIYEDQMHEQVHSRDYTALAMVLLEDLRNAIVPGMQLQSDVLSKIHLKRLLSLIDRSLNHN